ncbi:MAG: CheY-like chemotaxis protein [Parasphingorhabdus sp.]|jgi:CheY-like chemotaxis protein
MISVLLIEDNPDNADLVCAYLDGVFDIEVVTNGPDAISYLESNVDQLPRVLLLDISLPGMDGTELLRLLRRDNRFEALPAIALTAHAMKDDKNRLLAIGFDDYISKPITDDQLLIDAINKQSGGRILED